METLEAIMTRRSVRRFKKDGIPEPMMKTLLEAAMNAPSAGNEQPWQFLVITERPLLNQIAEFHPHAKMLNTAPMAVLICGDLRQQKHEGMWVQDCSAAIQNLLLAAHASGLGAVWVGIHPRAERETVIRDLCDLPEYIVPVALVPLGFPDEKPAAVRRFDAARIHANRW